MGKVVVVGSGASGVHFALTLLRKGYDVLMLDAGRRQQHAVKYPDTFRGLKENLPDPVSFFLGQAHEAVIFPDEKGEFYGIPPSKNYVFSRPGPNEYVTDGFTPLFSLAQGGLAQAWTGGVYPFNQHEMTDFPFSYEDFAPYYGEVADRIGISGALDDLAQFFPVHDHLMEPLRLDPHSSELLKAYEKKKSVLNTRYRCYFGRTRVATLSRDKDGRKGCTYSGRCLWGCAHESLYTPSITLEACKQYSNFTYVPNQYVSHFECDHKGRISQVVVENGLPGHYEKVSVERLVLAAGALFTSKIFLTSILFNEGERIELSGLMDNRQVLVPFVNLKMIGKVVPLSSYQYHQVGMGIDRPNPKEYVHGQVTTLKSALYHPIIQKLPLDLKASVGLFRGMHAALGVVNLNFHDTRRSSNYITLEVDRTNAKPKVVLKYIPRVGEEQELKEILKKTRKALLSLDCIAPSAMTHVRPMGASVHYAGTIPMSAEKRPLTVSPFCQSHDFDNLYIVDGATFPFLPAKNITFSLMANAIRVADTAF